MDSTARRIRRIIGLMHDRGHLAPDHATAAASKLLEAEPLPPGFAFVAAALVRHAAILAPFDRDKLRLADDVNTPMRHSPFDSWLARAQDLTQMEPVPENIPMPSSRLDSPADFVRYMQCQPANIMRLPALLALRRMGAEDEFDQAVQTMSGSPSGMLAAPIMAWNAHFLGENLLAEMLLDEGIPNFLTHNLRAVYALDRGQHDMARTHLVNSLEHEPFQPAIIAMVADIHFASTNEIKHTLESLHDNIARKMTLVDMEAINAELREDAVEDFVRTLGQALPAFRANATVFWQTLALSLR